MKNLEKLRLAARLSRAELSKKMGVTVHGYSRWERGEVEPRAGQLVELVKHLNCSFNALLTGQPDEDEAHKIRVQVKPGDLMLVEILGEPEQQKQEVYTPSFKLRNTKRKKVSKATKKAAAG